MKKLISSILFFIFFANGAAVFATDNRVYFKGPISAIAPESEFLINILLDAQDPINAFDLEIAYPQDKLKFLNFDNTQSIVDIWQMPPSVLPNGNLKLSGGIIKAFSGSSGLLIKLSFSALNSGQVKLSFMKNNLYIADGKGTEVKASTETFPLSVADNAPIIYSPIIPFKSTPTDILIQQELKTFKSDMLWKRIFTPLLIFVVVLFVICALAVYNKFKRKSSR